MKGAEGWLIPPRARRVRSRFSSFSDRGRIFSSVCQPVRSPWPAITDLIFGRAMAAAAAAARAGCVDCSRRLRSGDAAASTYEAADPASSAIETKTAASAKKRVSVIPKGPSVPNVDQLPDDERADYLENHADDDHPDSQRIGRQNLKLLGAARQHEQRHHRRHARQHVCRDAAMG